MMTAFRWHPAAALLLVSIGTLRIIATFAVFNHTIDEPDNLAAGMEYLSTGRYLYEDVHPPLARIFGAAGPFLAGERFRPGPGAYSEGYRILGRGAHYDRVLALARAGILPFFWAASLVVYLWGRRAGGPGAALLAVALFTTTPAVLALAGIVNTDLALCATLAASVLASLYWADRPTTSRSVVLGLLVAFACLSKFTAIPFLAAAWMLMLLTQRTPVRLMRDAWARRRHIGMVLGLAALAIWAGYGFTFARVEWLHARVPAPRFWSGLHTVWAHNRAGHPAYLFGSRSPDGFWYYFPAALAIKTPLAFLALVTLSFRRARRLEIALPLAFSAGILLVAMTGRVNIGVRYVLPVYVGFAIAAACAAIEARARLARIAIALLLAWHIASGAIHHPDYLAYTNEIAGRHPENFVVDSDLDWGQDMKRLAAFLQAQKATHVTFTPFNRAYPFPIPMSPAVSDSPSPGWNAASVTLWKLFGVPSWADRLHPQKRIGRSILVWHVEKP